jgi:chromate transport protein ChrA
VTWAEILRVVAVALAFVMPAAFCTCYHLWTRGHWKDSRYGVHLMVVSGVDALIVLYVLLAMLDVVPLSWRPYSGFIIYLSFAGTFLWRLILLAHDHRKVGNGTTGVGRP